MHIMFQHGSDSMGQSISRLLACSFSLTVPERKERLPVRLSLVFTRIHTLSTANCPGLCRGEGVSGGGRERVNDSTKCNVTKVSRFHTAFVHLHPCTFSISNVIVQGRVLCLRGRSLNGSCSLSDLL